MFVWTKERLERIGAVNFARANDIKDKQLHIVGYLCELVCDLTLAPGNNVSRSLGFETSLRESLVEMINRYRSEFFYI
jgi:hypothetical protein